MRQQTEIDIHEAVQDLRSRAAAAGQYICAYILDDTQPVICSYVSDQPLFFSDIDVDMDEEECEGDEFCPGAEDIDISGHSLDLNEKIDRFVGSLNAPENGAEIRPFSDPNELEACLRQSGMAAALLDAAGADGVRIIFDTQEQGVVYHAVSGEILVNPDLLRMDILTGMITALRRHWQRRQGAGISPLAFAPEEAVFIHRMQSADIAVIVAQTAWEMNLAGDNTLFSDLIETPLWDVAMALASAARVDFRTLMNGRAQKEAFDAWFSGPRLKNVDRAVVQKILAQTEDQFEELEASAQIASLAMEEILIRLGTRPCGKNYLAPWVESLCDDPIYSEIRDRSNANFLWFIKFERSCRDQERELQKETASSDPADLPSRLTAGSLRQENEKGADHESVQSSSGPQDGIPDAGKILAFPKSFSRTGDGDRSSRARPGGSGYETPNGR